MGACLGGAQRRGGDGSAVVIALRMLHISRKRGKVVFCAEADALWGGCRDSALTNVKDAVDLSSRQAFSRRS